MKTELVLKKMMLLGFMFLAVSINVFANNANEEKNSVNRNGENLLVIAADPSVTDPYVMEVEEDAQGSIMIVPPAGYTCDPDFETIENNGCIILNDNSRGLVINFIANCEGVARLQVRVVVIGGGGRDIIINIIINVRPRKG